MFLDRTSIGLDIDMANEMFSSPSTEPGENCRVNAERHAPLRGVYVEGEEGVGAGSVEEVVPHQGHRVVACLIEDGNLRGGLSASSAT